MTKCPKCGSFFGPPAIACPFCETPDNPKAFGADLRYDGDNQFIMTIPDCSICNLQLEYDNQLKNFYCPECRSLLIDLPEMYDLYLNMGKYIPFANPSAHDGEDYVAIWPHYLPYLLVNAVSKAEVPGLEPITIENYLVPLFSSARISPDVLQKTWPYDLTQMQPLPDDWWNDKTRAHIVRREAPLREIAKREIVAQSLQIIRNLNPNIALPIVEVETLSIQLVYLPVWEIVTDKTTSYFNGQTGKEVLVRLSKDPLPRIAGLVSLVILILWFFLGVCLSSKH